MSTKTNNKHGPNHRNHFLLAGLILSILLFSACGQEETSIELCENGTCSEYVPPESGPAPKIENGYPSARGSFTVDTRGTIFFPLATEFKAVTSHNNQIFFYLEFKQGTDIYYERIYQWDHVTHAFELKCNWIRDSERIYSLSVTDTYYYFKTNSSSAKFRRFRRSDCTEATAISTSIYASSSYGYFVQNWSQNNIDYLVYLTSNKMDVVGEQSQVLEGSITELKYGSATVNFYQFKALLVASEIWLVSSTRLWNFDADWGTANYANLPTGDYSDFSYVKGLAQSSADHLYVFHGLGYTNFKDRIGYARLNISEF